MKFSPSLIAAAFLGFSLLAQQPAGASASTPGPAAFSRYFEAETATIEGRCLSGINSLEDWKSRREELRAQLLDMLGLQPLPPRTELDPMVTGTLKQPEFTVEKVRFEAMPHVYVTANLYLPNSSDPCPAILYACGHARMFTNGVSCGNKSWYQHHGQWFARNGYVCLIIDSLQLGEIEGLHHGTYREGQWWWNSRGYTPAGVEAWFGIRALDYLCSRPEVDKDRIGMTGRSGGGSYTWTVAALDERVKVAAPVAGMTDLRNQVVDGVVHGHCDCMFFLNTYRWDFPQLAALIAPRPLLIANSDKDTIFPLNGIVRLHERTRRIYELYGATNKLGLLITEGPHADTQDLQLPVFRWFNRFLKQQDPIIETAARKFAEPRELRVFDQSPPDQLNTRIQNSFVPQASEGPVGTERTWPEISTLLQEKVFRGWPAKFTSAPELVSMQKTKGLRYASYRFSTQPGIEVQLYIISSSRAPKEVVLTALDTQTWTNSPLRALWEQSNADEISPQISRQLLGTADKAALAFFVPRAVEPVAWVTNKARLTQVRRQYMLLGQTLDGMRVWDIRCAVQSLHSLPEFRKANITLRARGEMAVNACYTALFEPAVKSLELQALPASHMQGPDYLNVLKVWDIPQMLNVLRKQAQVRVDKYADPA